jgi:hypothetical protein
MTRLRVDIILTVRLFRQFELLKTQFHSIRWKQNRHGAIPLKHPSSVYRRK